MFLKLLLFLTLSFLIRPYTLVWSDEFDSPTLDTSSWTVQEYDNPQNNEMEAYTRNNVYIADGKLILIAKQENWGSKHYTSGKVVAEGKRDFLYGKFEARLKMPIGKGLWPAFWMMPTYKGQYWPSTGEIDIMETIGSDHTNTHATLHFGTSVATHKWKGDPYAVPGGYSNDFHVYTCEWQPGKITFYVDGVLFSTRTPGDVDPWPFDDGNKFYIILNFAVGGDWPGPPDGSAHFPATFEIDYVRVYQGSPVPSGGIVNADMDIKGDNLRSVSHSNWADCFLPCYNTQGCNSFAWNNYLGGTCWLKKSDNKADLVSKSSVYSAFLCHFTENKDITGNDIAQRSGNDPKVCCGICAGLDGCKAWSWSSWNGGTCFLKSGGSLIDKQGVIAWSA